MKIRELKNLLCFLFVIIFFNCKSNVRLTGETVQIDAGPFTIETPDNYKLIKEQGIDSYVGKITNGRIEFGFDYGWYSNSDPSTYYDYVKKYLFRYHKNELKETCKLSASVIQELKDKLIILQAEKNPNFPETSDKEISTTIQLGTGNCTIYLQAVVGDIMKNYDNYTIMQYENGKYMKKLFFSKDRTQPDAGVYFSELSEDRNTNKLNLRTFNYSLKDSVEIATILNSVKLK